LPLHFLGKRNIPCPTPVKNIHGTEMHLEELKVQVDEKWFENNGGCAFSALPLLSNLNTSLLIAASTTSNFITN